MTGQHRTTTPWGKLTAALVAVLAVVGLIIGGVADAHTRNAPRGVTVARTQPVPMLNRGESATFRIVDTGTALYIHGDADGLAPGVEFTSLLYLDQKCSQPEPDASLTLAGTWRRYPGGHATLDEVKAGGDYTALRGHIGSESVRATTAAVNAGNGNFTLTEQARACAPVVPGR